ncbi:hypothetical protein [Anaerosporobacter sp.]
MFRKKRLLLYVLLLTCVSIVVGCSGKKSGDKGSKVNNTDNQNTTENITVDTLDEQDDKDKKNQAMGRYIEKPCGTIGDGANISEMTLMEDGNLVILDTQIGALFTSKDVGDTWSSEEVRAMSSVLTSSNCEVTSAAVSKNGDIFFSYIPWDEVTDKKYSSYEKYVYIAKDNKKKELKLTVSKKNSWLQQAEFTADNELYALTHSGELIKINVSDESVEKVFEGESSLDTFAVDKTYIVAQGGDIGYIYNTDTKELITNDSVLNDFLDSTIKEIQLCKLDVSDKENAIYVTCQFGVYRHVLNGNVMEQLVSGELTNLGSPSISVTSFQVKEDGSFLIGYTSGELDSYCYNADVPSVPSNQIRVYSLYESKTIQQAIADYRKNNPDMFIKLEIGLTGNDAMTKTDAIQKLNTSVLAGDGPDIIILDGLPMDSYIEKGVLYDLSNVMKEIEQSDTYFTNITHAYEKENGLYGVPMKFQIPIVTGNEKEISKVDTLEKLSQMIKDMREDDNNTTTIMGAYTPQQVLERMELGCSSSWLMKDGKMDEAKLKEYLIYAKDIYEFELEDLSEDVISMQKEYLKEVNEKLNGQTGKILTISTQLMSVDRKIVIGNINEIYDYQILLASLSQDTSISYQRFDMQSKYNFVPNGIVAVNAASKDMETTIDFFKTLYSKKLQEADVDEGLPVNKEVFSNLAKGKNVMDHYIGTSDQNGNEVSYHLTIPTDVDMKALTEMADSLSTPCLMDSTIQDTIETYGEKVLSSEISIDEGVRAIVQKVNLYLQE